MSNETNELDKHLGLPKPLEECTDEELITFLKEFFPITRGPVIEDTALLKSKFKPL
jgi:hypothetical protein